MSTTVVAQLVTYVWLDRQDTYEEKWIVHLDNDNNSLIDW